MIPIIIIALAIASGILYRMGGSGNYSRLCRVLGCPALFIVSYLLISGVKACPWWSLLLTFGLSAGAISAYWGLDEKKWGYWAHGLGLGIAALPIAIATGDYLSFSLRLAFITAGICVWSQLTKWDVLEETGRGFILGISELAYLL
jgi:hypothetical protein